MAERKMEPVIPEKDLARIGAITAEWAKGFYKKGMTKEQFEAVVGSALPAGTKAAPPCVHDAVDTIWDYFFGNHGPGY